VRAALAGLLGALAIALAPSAAGASTIPPLDLRPGEAAFGFGLTPLPILPMGDLSFDQAIDRERSLGAVLHVMTPLLHPDVPKPVAAGRLAWMPGGGPLGMLFTVGAGSSPWAAGDVFETFVQAAAAARLTWGFATLRVTVGPALIFMVRTKDLTGAEGVLIQNLTPPNRGYSVSVAPLLPNAELGFRLGARHEIVLGGYTLLGYRGRF
jgi:hypothetical protein